MSLCMGCMKEIGYADICPECGFDNADTLQSEPCLPLKVSLQSRYTVGKSLDINGQGITYLGYDSIKDMPVRIYEFFPSSFCRRSNNGTDVIIEETLSTTFKMLQKEFQAYYRNLSEFKELQAFPCIYDVFIENNTTYAVCESYELISFSEFVSRSGGQVDWDVARPLFMPLLNAMAEYEKSGFGHYGISPDNLFVTPQGKIKLLGFAIPSLRRTGMPVKAELYSGSSAPEQYKRGAPVDCSTDVYGFTAVLYCALSGKLPDDARKRIQDGRILISNNTVKRLPPHVVAALANGLQVGRNNRISDFDKLRSQLSAAPTVKAIQEEISRTSTIETTDYKDEIKSIYRRRSWAVLTAVISLVIFTALGILWLGGNPLLGLIGKDGGEEETEPQTVVEQDWTGPVVPKLIGMEYSQAAEQYKAGNVIQIYRSFDDEYNDKYKEGVIISQSPPEGSAIKEANGSAVYVVISKGPMVVELPEVENKNIDEAAEQLAKLGFVINAEGEYNEEKPEGTVLGYTNYTKGSKLEVGVTITLRYSLGQKPTEPPTEAPTVNPNR